MICDKEFKNINVSIILWKSIKFYVMFAKTIHFKFPLVSVQFRHFPIYVRMWRSPYKNKYLLYIMPTSKYIFEKSNPLKQNVGGPDTKFGSLNIMAKFSKIMGWQAVKNCRILYIHTSIFQNFSESSWRLIY